jgi:hypothetical protein
MNHTDQLFEQYKNGFVGAETCIATIFPDVASRISLRHFRELQATGFIPYLKLGRRTLFNVAEVKAALENRLKRKAVQP